MTDNKTITPDQYLASCKRRFGTSNPFLHDEPVWEWMIRTEQNPCFARTELGLELNLGMPGEPDWCFVRMGSANVELADGRRITIAGEYEDYYDPDFCIYNDVIVKSESEIKIYGYPTEVFPPTDFHSATLVGNSVIIIGSLGYPKSRRFGETQVLAMSLEDYRISKVACFGTSPGWIHGHTARVLDDESTIEIRGGHFFYLRESKEIRRRNKDVFHLDTSKLECSRITNNHHWREFAIKNDEDIDNAPRPPWTEEQARQVLGWYTGKVLNELEYQTELADRDLEDEADEPGEVFHVLIVDGVRVRIYDEFRELAVLIEGHLEEHRIERLLNQLTDLLRSTERKVGQVEEV